MAEYRIEADDDQAQILADVLENAMGRLAYPVATKEHVLAAAAALRAQIPVPVPDRIGAVVQTDQGQFIRWSFDNHTFSPWIAVGDHETPLRTDEIGRITEVLSAGVDI